MGRRREHVGQSVFAVKFAILFRLDVGRLAKSKFDGRLGKLN